MKQLTRIITRGGVLEDALGLEKASRTHFQVLGPGLEAQLLAFDLKAYKSSKMSCPRLEDSIIF